MGKLLFALALLWVLTGPAAAQSLAFRLGYFDGCERAKYDSGFPVIRIEANPNLVGTRDYEQGWAIGYQSCNVDLAQELICQYR